MTLTCSATSEGGTNSKSVTIKRDATAPSVTVTGVSNGANYLIGAVPTAGCSTTDGLSGVATNVDVSVIGGNGSGVGTFTATCSGAQDVAGKSAPAVSVTYTVGYVIDGFAAPVDNGALNVAKAGQAIPLKWRLLDANGAPVTNLNATNVKVVVQALTCSGAGTTADEIEEYAAGSSGLQNLGDGYYQLNWQSPKNYANSCKTLYLDLAAGSSGDTTTKLDAGLMKSAMFQFKK